jgi:hypothetical protein
MLVGALTTARPSGGRAFLEEARVSLSRVTKLVTFLLPVVILALAALPATAQVVGDGFYLVAPDGTVQAFELAEVDEQPYTYFVNVVGLADPAQLGNAIALLNADQEISDIFGVIELDDGNVYLAFGSDALGRDAVFPYDPSMYMYESDDGYHNATVYLDPNLQALGYTLWFYSDPGPDQ